MLQHIGKDLVGSGLGLVEALFWYFPRVTVENQERLRMAGVPCEIGTENTPPDRSLEHYCYTNLLGREAHSADCLLGRWILQPLYLGYTACLCRHCLETSIFVWSLKECPDGGPAVSSVCCLSSRQPPVPCPP
jgi:hypothetical protein